MSDDRSTFETTRARLEDIVAQVRRKDVSLEQSLDLLEEAVRLVNQCNELIDQTSFRASADAGEGEAEAVEAGGDAAEDSDAPADAVAVVEMSELIEIGGEDVVAIGSVEVVDVAGTAVAAELEDDERS
jgi:exodeoxyribonuclease VII small subunit